MQGESYVVRIYRRGPTRAAAGRGRPALAGVVEDVETGRRRSFRSAGELWALLCHPRQVRRASPAAPRPRIP